MAAKKDGPKPAEEANPMVPAAGNEFHVVLTHIELVVLINSSARSIIQITQSEVQDVAYSGIAMQQIAERMYQLCGFLASAKRPTLH